MNFLPAAHFVLILHHQADVPPAPMPYLNLPHNMFTCIATPAILLHCHKSPSCCSAQLYPTTPASSQHAYDWTPNIFAVFMVYWTRVQIKIMLDNHNL